jgi:hypothetical protein
MFCPQCGTENEAGNRFCVSCGSSLAERPGSEAAAPSLRKRLRSVLGETRRARILTAATLAAIVVAVIAFIALEPSDGGEDAFLQQVDQSCVAEKGRISQLEQETLRQAPPSITEFASVLVTIVAEWRVALQADRAPPIHAAAIQELDTALREVLIEGGSLARVAREGGSASAIASRAAAVDAATVEADREIDELGLDDCSDLSVSPAASSAP